MTIVDPDGDLRPGEDFRFTAKPSYAAAALFVAVTNDAVITARRFTTIAHLPDKTPVIAMWHGERRTDGFRTTVGDLKIKAGGVEDADALKLARDIRI